MDPAIPNGELCYNDLRERQCLVALGRTPVLKRLRFVSRFLALCKFVYVCCATGGHGTFAPWRGTGAPRREILSSRPSAESQNNFKLECGPMPNVMVALPNIGGALCSTPQRLADAH